MVFKLLSKYFRHSFFLIFLSAFQKRIVKIFQLKNFFAFQLRELQILILIFQYSLENLSWVSWININQRMLSLHFTIDIFLKTLNGFPQLIQKSFEINFFEAIWKTGIILTQMRDQGIQLSRMDELMPAYFLLMFVFTATLSADWCYFGAWVFASVFVDNAIMRVAKWQHIFLIHSQLI